MITVEEYYRKPHSSTQESATVDLLDRRNRLRAEWSAATGMTAPVDPDTGTEISGKQGGDGDGGFRTPGSKTGAVNSSHREARAVDDYDPGNEFDTWLDSFEGPDGENSKLEEYGLYREASSHTPGWTHLQTRPPASGRRSFIP